jgi:hypothetical protein
VGRIAGLPATRMEPLGAGIDLIQPHVNLLAGKAHASPMRVTATSPDAAEMVRDTLWRQIPDVCWSRWITTPKLTSEVFRPGAFANGMGPSLNLRSANR